MAKVLSLGNVDFTSTISLLGGVLELDSTSWSTRTASVEGEYRYLPYGALPVFKNFGVVVEQMRLVGEDTIANLVDAAVDIDTLLEAVRLYHNDDLHVQSQWFYWNADGENAKRALILEGALRYAVQAGVSPLLNHGAMVAELAFTRHPLFENVLQTVDSEDSVSCFGGKWTWSAIPGTAPARLWYSTFEAYSGSGGPIHRLWAGIRESYYGMTAFDPVWELENGTNYTDAADVADGTASEGSKVQVNFATTATMEKRCAIKPEDTVLADWTHYVGQYLILLRCKVGSDTTCAVQLKSGYWGTTNPRPCEVVYVDNTSWRLVPLGEIQMPPMGWWYGASVTMLRRFQLQIWAERVSGSGVLDLDALCFIPAEHFLALSGMGIQYVGGDTRPAKCITRENDTQLAEGYANTFPEYDVALETRDWYLPTGSGMMVIAGEREAQHVLTDGLDLEIRYLPRWRSYRGT